MTSCPCCGSQVDRPVCVSLDTNTVSTAMGSVRLPPEQAAAIFILAKKYPETVRHDTFGVALFGDVWWDSTQNRAAVQVCLARKAIKPIGVGITSVFGVGYRLSLNKIEGARA